MNRDTGKIFELTQKEQDIVEKLGVEKAEVELNAFLLENKPWAHCRKCKGKGYAGRNPETNHVIPCKCVRKRISKNQQPERK